MAQVAETHNALDGNFLWIKLEFCVGSLQICSTCQCITDRKFTRVTLGVVVMQLSMHPRIRARSRGNFWAIIVAIDSTSDHASKRSMRI